MTEVVAIPSIMINLGLALLLGCVIGLERQIKQRHSGLVTHGLVALGAAAYASLPYSLGLGSDLRMGSQVVTGIGFLGAGLIIKDGASIKGLSTAATVWSTGAVGVLTGYGMWLLAIETAFFIVCLNISLPRIAVLVNRYSFVEPENEQFYLVKFRCPSESEIPVRALLIQTLDLKKLRPAGRSAGSADEPAFRHYLDELAETGRRRLVNHALVLLQADYTIISKHAHTFTFAVTSSC